MALSSSQLEAFAEVARTGSFSQAAQNLHVTQSALSQRVLNLERELGVGLIIRDPSGLRLTSIGEELVRYCQIKQGLESEILARITSSNQELRGSIRIAGFSSVMRSVIAPSISKIIRANSDINVELFTREIRQLPRMLANNEADVIITAEVANRQDVVSHELGFESNVLVESTSEEGRSDVYLDHDPDDSTTTEFFRFNGKSADKLRRNYLDEVYSLIDGVKLGWGRAVLPHHLIRQEPDLRIVRGYKPLKVPVMLQYFRQPYYPRLQQSLIDQICQDVPARLRIR